MLTRAAGFSSRLVEGLSRCVRNMDWNGLEGALGTITRDDLQDLWIWVKFSRKSVLSMVTT